MGGTNEPPVRGLGSQPFQGGEEVSWEKVKTFTKELVKRFSITVSDINAKARSLSGGNRQRHILAREPSKRCQSYSGL